MKIKNTAELVDRLNRLTKAINEDNDLRRTLNSGGCAFFAVRVAKAVKMNILGLSIFDDYEKAIEIFPKVLAKAAESKKNQTVAFWGDNCIQFNHVVIKFMINNEVMYYDGVRGLMTEKEGRSRFCASCYGEEIGIAPVEMIAPLTKTQRGWNRAFRGRSIVDRLVKGILQDKWNA